MIRTVQAFSIGAMATLPLLAFGRGEDWMPKPSAPPPVESLTNEARGSDNSGGVKVVD